MSDDDIVLLDHMKHDWYEKGKSFVNIVLYVRNAVDVNVEFEEDKVVATISTRDLTFLKWHASGSSSDKKCFKYQIRTRDSIICSESHFKVKPTNIEIILKKKSSIKWGGLHYLCDGARDNKKSPHQQAMSSKQQLLGGKSTPLTKKSSDDGKKDIEVEHSPGPSNIDDKRNIRKSVSVALLTDVQLGMVGLENYANNCYMNVVVQVLSNIQETRDYFKNDHFIKDINTNNPLGSGGKVAKTFADIIKTLWSTGRKVFKPVALKNIMGKQCSLFLGWQQHDAQEFFASLLDNLHEDLNQIQCERSSEKDITKSDFEPSANEKPESAWSSHLKRNNSFMVKLFHGQLMSKLTCAACHKVSYSFDPCAQISLPIPSNKQQYKVFFFTRDVKSVPILVNVQISTTNAQLWHLLNVLQPMIKVPPHLISMFKGTYDIMESDQLPITAANKYKYIVCSEICAKDEVGVLSLPVFQYTAYAKDFFECDFCYKSQKDLETKLKRCTNCLSVSYCSRDCQSQHWRGVHSKVCHKELKKSAGVPFHVTVTNDTLTFNHLEESLRELAKHSVECTQQQQQQQQNIPDNLSKSDTCLSENNKSTHNLQNCSLLIKTSSKINCNDDSVCTPISTENLSFELLSKSSSLIMEWQNSPTTEQIEMDVMTKEVPNYEMFSTDSAPYSGVEKDKQCSLSDCIKFFMEPERLDEKESWRCPKCKAPRSAKKEMAISSPPCLLLLHLKRFTYGEYGQKINKGVTYPLSGFDLSPYIAKETRSKIDYSTEYDLVGVITHRGNMRMGHYTCMVRLLNQLDKEENGWRHFDDDSVLKIKSEKVVSSDAYVLIYRIRNLKDTVKLEKCPSMPTMTVASSISDNGIVKRKRADNQNATSASKQLADRKCVSEHTTLNKVKRSTSVDAHDEDAEKKTEAVFKQPGHELWRSVSAQPVLNSHVSTKECADYSTDVDGVDAKTTSSRLSSTSSEEYVDCTSHFINESLATLNLKSNVEEGSNELTDSKPTKTLNEEEELTAPSLYQSFENLSIEATQNELYESVQNTDLVDSNEYFNCDEVNDSPFRNVVMESYHDINENDLD